MLPLTTGARVRNAYRTYLLQGDTPEKFKDRMAKMNINLGAWRRDEKVIGWLVQKSRDYLADPTVLNALDAL